MSNVPGQPYNNTVTECACVLTDPYHEQFMSTARRARARYDRRIRLDPSRAEALEKRKEGDRVRKRRQRCKKRSGGKSAAVKKEEEPDDLDLGLGEILEVSIVAVAAKCVI